MEEGSPEHQKLLLEIGTAIRDAQLAAFVFAKTIPGESNWLMSLFNNLSATVKVMELQMRTLTPKKTELTLVKNNNNQGEKPNGEK